MADQPADACDRWRERLQCDAIIGRSERLADALRLACAAAQCELPVLLLGPSGTGKNLLARAIHDASPRGEKPYVGVACPSFPDTLFESHLFGAVRGAFTGSVHPIEGFVERANGGTLFLDEIGEVGGPIQAKLLVLLQSGAWTRLGDTRERKADLRVIAATNARRDQLRDDLFHRLGGFVIEVPALADRIDDVPLLAERIVNEHARGSGKAALPMSDGAMGRLLAHDWPGNVRELENVLRRALVLAWMERSDAIRVVHLTHATGGAGPREGDWDRDGPLAPHRLRDQLRAYQRWLVDRCLDWAAGDVGLAAGRLGMSPSWVYKQLGQRLRSPAD